MKYKIKMTNNKKDKLRTVIYLLNRNQQ